MHCSRTPPNETQTQSEKDWVRAQIAQIGDVGFFVNAISAAVMFALLFVTGNTMMQSVRERVPELAVLKTYGFSNTAVVSLVIAESLVLCCVAAAGGIGIAAAISPPLFREFGVGGLSLPLPVIGLGFGVAAVFAIVSAALPALRVQRLSIVDASRGADSGSKETRAREHAQTNRVGDRNELAQCAAALRELDRWRSSGSRASSPSCCRCPR